ncbi:MAG TPA: fumarylacetoacetate hydrolase family protein [Candidatus Limnocylindrales bacterium]|nr:fumarylacetoacetate hydrolase family protein [Candidatus Limnocylindrales bacterium]
MRFATLVDGERAVLALVRGDRLLPLDGPDAPLRSLREVAASGADVVDRVRPWADRQPAGAWRPLADAVLGPAVPEPGAIYTIGLNYVAPGEPADAAPSRPLVYAKLPSSVGGHAATVSWDRTLTANVDAEVELGVVIGIRARAVAAADAMRHVFGYTCVNDMSSRDTWLDGDQWLLGKSMAGFCPVGPFVATPDELPTGPLRLGCTVNGVAIQDGSTADMRFSIAEVVAFLSRHVTLHPGDLIATGTPARLDAPPGPDRHLEPGDRVTVWIDGLGELTTVIA